MENVGGGKQTESHFGLRRRPGLGIQAIFMTYSGHIIMVDMIMIDENITTTCHKTGFFQFFNLESRISMRAAKLKLWEAEPQKTTRI